MNLLLTTKLVGLDDFELIVSFSGKGIITLLFSILGIAICIFWVGITVASIYSIENIRPIHLKVNNLNQRQKQRLYNMLDYRATYVAVSTLANHIAKSLIVFLSFLPAPFLITHLYKVAYGPSVAVEINWLHMFLGAGILFVPALILCLVLGELVPKTYALVHPIFVSDYLFPFMRLNAITYKYLSYFLLSLASMVTRRFGKVASFLIINNQAEEEIKNLAESAEAKGEMESEEKRLIHSVFQFGDTIAREVMTPRVDLEAVPVSASVKEVMDIIGRSGYSRIPVYKESGDLILGIIHAKDLLFAYSKNDPVQMSAESDIRQYIRPVLFVPETKRLRELLEELKSKRMHMAVVQDELGGTAGVITVEDIIEELVGDIVDEYDSNEDPEVFLFEDGHSVDGKLSLHDLNEQLGSHFQSEEFDTIGGYVFGLFGKQPLCGESVTENNYHFTVLETDGRRVARVKVVNQDKIRVEALQEDEWFR